MVLKFQFNERASPSYPFFTDFYGVTNAPRDNGGSSNYEEKNNGMKVYSYVYTLFYLAHLGIC